MNTVQHVSQNIPYHLLSAWEGNVRKTVSDEYIDQLATSIEAHGLIQPLIVSKGGDGKFAVVAGRCRYRAIGKLVDEGKREKDTGVNCVVQDASSDSTELSLLENFMRLPMHPADQFEAFRDLADKGFSAAEIAARFGIADSRVLKLLKLGRLSPQVMQAYRDEKLDMDEIQAFAISDDHEAQNQLLAAIEAGTFHGSAHYIRNHFVQGELPATDKRVKFIGLDFYELCGGTVRRDLFDDRNNGYIQDVALLDSCVQGKFQELIGSLKAEGWGWVEAHADRDWQYMQEMDELSPEEQELAPEIAAKVEALQEEYSQYEDGFDEEDEALSAHVDGLWQQIEAIEASRYVWTAEQKAGAGVYLSLEHNGSVKIEYGLVKLDNASQSEELEEEKTESASALVKVKPEFSAALMKDLTAHRTAAMRAELASQPHIALVAVVYALAARMFYSMPFGHSLQIHGTPEYILRHEKEEAVALKALEGRKSCFNVPKEPEQLWDWLIRRPHDELLAILAVCAAEYVNAVDNGSSLDKARLAHADQLATALNLDMRKWFKPTAANFFSRISKKQIIGAYIELKGEQPSNGILEAKKAALAARAERDLGDTWLPSVLRIKTE